MSQKSVILTYKKKLGTRPGMASMKARRIAKYIALCFIALSVLSLIMIYAQISVPGRAWE